MKQTHFSRQFQGAYTDSNYPHGVGQLKADSLEGEQKELYWNTEPMELPRRDR